MSKRFVMLVALCAAWSAPRLALADPVIATAPVALFDVNLVDGADLASASGLAMDFGTTTARGAGDFAAIPSGTPVTVDGPLYLYTALGGAGSSPFSFSIGGFGRFTETAMPLILSNSLTATSTGIEAYLLGVFSPAGSLAGFTPGPASFDVSFTRSSANSIANGAMVASTSGSGTLASPPSALSVTEPGSLLLVATGAGLMGLMVADAARERPATA